MKIAIGLPAAVPGVSGTTIVEWAKEADDGPFSSVGVIDRIVFPNFEALTVLAAAAAVTSRVGLITGVLLATVRNAGVLAKTAASIDAISGGRLSLGLGIGGRRDDFLAAPAEMGNRGRRFDEQLALMRRAWSGEAISDEVGPIGPPTVRAGGPEILIGARAERAIGRIGKWADGYLAPPVLPAMIEQLYAVAEKSWREHARSGKPRLVCLEYFALGHDAEEASSVSMRSYYGFQADGGESAVKRVLRTPQEIKDNIAVKEGIGVDELLLMPSVDNLAQVKRLADVVG